MRWIIRSGLLALLVVSVAGVLTACGDEGDTRSRGPAPFLRIRLKNTSLPPATPANAHAEGTKGGKPSQTHDVGPVPPGDEQTSQPPGTKESDGVAITVTFESGAVFRGGGSYPGSWISEVYIECGEPMGGQATVHFASGRPPAPIELHP